MRELEISANDGETSVASGKGDGMGDKGEGKDGGKGDGDGKGGLEPSSSLASSSVSTALAPQPTPTAADATPAPRPAPLEQWLMEPSEAGLQSQPKRRRAPKLEPKTGPDAITLAPTAAAAPTPDNRLQPY